MNPMTRHILASAVALTLAAVTAAAETLVENPPTAAPKHQQQAPATA